MCTRCFRKTLSRPQDEFQMPALKHDNFTEHYVMLTSHAAESTTVCKQ